MNLAYKKILGKFTKVLGFGKTPPHVGKNSQMISFFFWERTLVSLVTIFSWTSQSQSSIFRGNMSSKRDMRLKMTMVLNLDILPLRNRFCSIKCDLYYYYIECFEPFNSRLKCLQGLFEVATLLKKNQCADFALNDISVSPTATTFSSNTNCVSRQSCLIRSTNTNMCSSW